MVDYGLTSLPPGSAAEAGGKAENGPGRQIPAKMPEFPSAPACPNQETAYLYRGQARQTSPGPDFQARRGGKVSQKMRKTENKLCLLPDL